MENMEIKCPHCGESFLMNKDIADHIREQVRTKVFEKEVKDRVASITKDHETQIKLQVETALSAARDKSDKQLAELRQELSDARSGEEKAKSDLAVAKASIQSDIAESVAEEAKKYQEKMDELRAKYEKEMAELRETYQAKIDSAREDAEDARAKADKAKADLDIEKAEGKLAVKQAIMDTKSEYTDIVSQLEADKKAVAYERDYYKDLKTKMSTKMVGETLEQHCEIEFNKIRMSAFPRAEFGKDNAVSVQSGSKGDYIFREYDDEGIEIISIMFEMKNEMDTTATKKTNAHFLKELDKDRREKKCEYAVLVSLLEADNDLYNQGIVDVSYQYPKMYVVRPQFFITIISILRNAAIRSMEAKRELRRMQDQNIDLQNFETNLNTFKEKFGYNYDQASKRFNEAITEIDKTIESLRRTKEKLLASDRQLRLANDKVEDVTIRKLTANSPSIRAQIEGSGI